MAKKEKTEEKIIAVESALNRTEQFFEDNYKMILSIVGGIALIVILFFAYVRFVKEPKNREAQAAMFMAQRYFEADSLNKALNGDGVNMGFLAISEDFSSTDAGNLANYYAGVIYMQKGQFDNAIEKLEKFDSDDQIVSSMALGLLGDANLEKNDMNKALDYYMKAANEKKNSFTTPMFLMRAGLTCELLNKWDEALKQYQIIKNEYSRSGEGQEIDKYISRANAKLNK
ncbi:MAG: tetratricopeptide repeat protein [Bacteroidota bacterium]|jgi:TolA-binding protein